MRIERQIHHYGSGLNALPLMSQFESDPSDLYLLRVAMGGAAGPLTNVDEGGFAAASFHSFADTLAWDGYSGDYGPNFVGLSLNQRTTLIQHPDFGWQAFNGHITSQSGGNIAVEVRDAVRRRIFIAPLAVRFEADAGAFDSFTFNPKTRSVTLTILPKPSGVADAIAAPTARVLTATTTSGGVSLRPSKTLKQDAGAFMIPFVNGKATVTFVPS